jgi:hypothetical protein
MLFFLKMAITTAAISFFDDFESHMQLNALSSRQKAVARIGTEHAQKRNTYYIKKRKIFCKNKIFFAHV